MGGHPLILADGDRAEQFLLLGRSRRLFDGFSTHTDGDGVVWATKAVGDHVFAVTWLGAGWAFDPAGQERRAQELNEKREAMLSADSGRHQQELEAIVAKLRLGTMAERLLWVIHQQVLRRRSSLLRLPDSLFAEAIWGAEQEMPTHWRKEVLAVLKGLTWLHIAEGPITESTAMGKETAMLTHVADLRGTPNDVCGDGCEGLDDRRHHHFLVNVGRGFLGILEQFVQEEDDAGVRTYAFPVQGRYRRQSSTLRKVGKSGQLVSIYLPAKLGDREACEALTGNQHRLLQAIVRETTRNTKKERQSVSEAEVMKGNVIPTVNGKDSFACDLLDPQGTFVGFNGNKLLKGRGYLVASEGGWLAKAGYSTDQISAFFEDLSVLADKLALIPVGIEAGTRSCLNLNQMSGLGPNLLRRLHLRIYAPADYLDRWNKTFGWTDETPEPMSATDPAARGEHCHSGRDDLAKAARQRHGSGCVPAEQSPSR